MPKLRIIGFTEKASIEPSGFVVAKEDILKKLGVPPEKSSILPSKPDKAIDLIEDLLKANNNVDVFLTGDPLFFSLGEKLVQRFPNAEVIPDVSYMQLAFSKLKTSWKEARFFSLHGRMNMELLLYEITKAKRFLFVFTDRKNSPNKIAEFLVKMEVENITFHVFERLGEKDEKIYTLPPKEAVKKNFLFPNSVIIEKTVNYPDPFLDELYETKRGLLTKRITRGALISLFGIKKKEILWDLGAGSGAVSITLSKFFKLVFAVEKEKEHIKIIRENRKQFGAWNVIPIEETVEKAIEHLPLPDAVFIGTGDLEVTQKIVDRLKPGGVIAATAVTLNAISQIQALKNKLKNLEIFQLNVVDYSERIPKAKNPVWLIKLVRST